MPAQNTGNGNLPHLRKLLIGTAAAAVIAGGVGGYVAAQTSTPPPLHLGPIAKQAGFADLVAKVKPAVVSISTTQKVQRAAALQADPQFQEMLRQFLGPNADRMFRNAERPTHALGSGFIVSPDGYIVTNNHVIDSATDIRVTFADGTIRPAHIVGRDDKTDIALLKVSTHSPLPYVAFGDSDKERIGDWVLAAGNPYGLGGTVTAGIISAAKRDINAGPYDDFLQIDAPINPGNSGGPLFDQSGYVIGIDTAIVSPSGGSVGIGFAIPSNIARHIVDELRAHGHVTRGLLGVRMQELTPALARATNNKDVRGVLVDSVVDDAPAKRAGVKQGDVITRFDGAPVQHARDLAIAVANTPPGKTVQMKIFRNGKEQTLSVTVGGEHPTKSAAAHAPEQHRVGLALAPASEVNPDLPPGTGVAVASVEPGSPADESGLRPGDIISRIGNHNVTTPAEAAAQIHAAEAANKDSVLLRVKRNGTSVVS